MGSWRALLCGKWAWGRRIGLPCRFPSSERVGLLSSCDIWPSLEVGAMGNWGHGQRLRVGTGLRERAAQATAGSDIIRSKFGLDAPALASRTVVAELPIWDCASRRRGVHAPLEASPRPPVRPAASRQCQGSLAYGASPTRDAVGACCACGHGTAACSARRHIGVCSIGVSAGVRSSCGHAKYYRNI